MQQKWLEDFKIAIIEKNFDTIATLLETMPEIKSIGDLKTSVALINEAKKLLIKEQQSLCDKMQKVQHSKKFLATGYQEEQFSKTC